MARTRPPNETMLLPAAPVDWGTPLVVALGARLGDELPDGPDEERMAPVELGAVPLPGTMGADRVGTGATGVGPVGTGGTTGVTTGALGAETDGATTTEVPTTGRLDGLTTGALVAGGAWIWPSLI